MVLVIASSTLAIVFTEVLLSLVKLTPPPHRISWSKGDPLTPDHRFIYSAKREFAKQNDKITVISTNKDGFRKHSLSENVANKKIVLIGDSFVWGLGVGDNQTMPAYLEEQIRSEVGENYTVVNAGLPGYSLGQEYALLVKRIIPEIKPDLVIWSINGTDWYENMERPLFYLKNEKLVYIPGIFYGSYWQLAFKKSMPGFLEKSKLYNFFLSQIQLFDPTNLFETKTQDGNLKKIITMLKQADSMTNLVVVRTPSQAVLANNQSSEDELWLENEALRDTLQKLSFIDINQRIKNSTLSARVLGAESGDGNSYFLSDSQDAGQGMWKHLSALGNQVFANEVFQALKENSKLNF